MGRVRRASVSLAFLLTTVGFAAGGPTESVYSALARQDAWLMRSNDGPAWQSYLRTAELRDMLSASSVDRRKLAAILGRYTSKAPGLDAAPFAATRRALTHLANDLNVPLALRWSEQMRAATLHSPGFAPAAIRDARYQAIDAKNALGVFLTNTDQATRDAWKSFIKWDDLEEQLKTETPDWKKLDGVVSRLFNGYPGLEFPDFVKTREALRKYTYLGKLADSGDGGRSVNQYRTALSDALDKYNSTPTTKHAGDVAALADWLEGIGRDDGVADQLRAAHSHPNIVIRVSEALLARRFSQPVNDSTQINEMILETHVFGTAVTNGMVTTDIVPNPNVAQIDIVFNGVTTTPSTGRQKPVTVRSTSVANLVARKPLYLYPADVVAAPTSAKGIVNTTIHNITPDNRLGRRLVEKIAWKRANEQKPKAEAIAAGRAARRLEAKIDEQTQQLLVNARARLRAQIQGPINQRGLIPETIKSASTHSHVIVSASQAGHGQLSAMSTPPAFDRGDVLVQLHESAINNTAEKAIAGLTLTDERIAELVEETTGEIPEELRIDDDDQPWSISFDWKQPVTVEFDEQLMKIAVRGRRFTSGERVLNKVMEMSATYLMQTVPGKGVVLTRQGDVEVAFPGTDEDARLRASDRVFKTLMQRKFSELFKPTIEGDGFELPGRFSELGRIRLNALSTEAGWLSLGWN